MLHAVVMAGGSGTRFWPRSRRSRPKQLLRLFGGRSMIQQTVDRIAPLIPPERVLVITGQDQAAAVREQLAEVPADNIVGEPAPRDTAPCVGLAALLVVHRDPDATMLVLSADHRIEPPSAFCASVRAACAAIEEDPTCFVVFGVVPTRAETGYGYIEKAEELGRLGPIPWSRVARFMEKPKRSVAEEYLEAYRREGTYLWNAGIFVWRASAILAALTEHRPEIAERLDRIKTDLGTEREFATIAAEFPEMTRVPIDRAVMERYPNTRVIPIDYEWSDVGDWRSLAELLPADAAGNVAQGPSHLVGTRNCIVVADENQPVVTLGLEDTVIVQSGGITFVAARDRLDELKSLVESLPGAGLDAFL